MNRLQTIIVNNAQGELADLFASIKRGIGMIPNAFVTLGTNSPALLAQTLQLNKLLQSQTTLSKRELEAINLAVSEDSGCDYCVAAHTLAGEAAGYTAEQMRSLRSGAYPSDPRLDTLIKFALRLANKSGTVPEAVIASLREADYSDQQIVETIGAVAAILFTNMLNRTNDTVLDFPRPD